MKRLSNKALFKNGDLVVIKDSVAMITGVQRVGLVDYWIREKPKNNQGHKAFNGNYKYFLTNPDGTGSFGPYLEDSLVKLT